MYLLFLKVTVTVCLEKAKALSISKILYLVHFNQCSSLIFPMICTYSVCLLLIIECINL